MTVSSTPAGNAVPQPLVVRTVAVDDPGALLALLPQDAPLAWVRRGDGLVGWGEVLRIPVSGPDRFAAAEDAWHRVLAHAVVRDEVGLPGTGPVAFGSFAFEEDSPRGGVVVVPRVVVGRRGTTAWLTTIDTGATIGPAPSLARAAGSRRPVTAPGAVRYDDGAVPAADWRDVVAQGVAAIRDGEVEKVVLARDVVATTERPLDPRWVLGRLADAYPSCWTFSVDGLLGATPELLVRSEKGLVTSRVLAGTIRRTGDDAADLARAAILAHSSKDLEEHEYAVSSVADALAPYCSSTNVPDVPFVLHLPNVLHLASDVTGVLAAGHGGVGIGGAGGAAGGAGAGTGGAGATVPGLPGPSSLALAAALHPTAAVCGTPTEAARALIARLEGMERGRYAGPVGWFGADGDGEWGIALRSAEVDPQDPHRLRLFAGCGIVAASDPAAELAESEAKLVPMRHALASD
ncbi:isochorismate synthase MenF [Cellulomonas fimi]|uniref:Chorismate-binding protein n=1 Tax=Cellulomonas fimi TaxID=1708 RepID=A0A7Y0QF84_CELFI|nr:chorismate-binding protein [Cellulomonas fimi]NMR18796.1 chorismate-binding protein [Cellulomonas fimi]